MDARSNLEDLFSAYDRPDAPGLSAYVRMEGAPTFACAYGMADLETGTPCQVRTNYRLASLTKQFTALAVLLLSQRGKLSLDERLPQFFPEFSLHGADITVRQLLTHTSGVVDYEECLPPGLTLPVLDRDVLRILLDQSKTYFPPGAQFRYSNSGYALLAQIVEVRSGQTFARFLADNVFRPLKMEGTVAYEHGISKVPDRAHGYTRKGPGWLRTDQSLTSSVLGDGGIYSSIADLQLWDRALDGTASLPRDLLDQAFQPAVASDRPETSYGFGWFVGTYRGLKELWHYGETIGFTTRISRFPEKQFAVILLANRNDAPFAELPHQVADRLLFP